jgi:hypothetical protein
MSATAAKKRPRRSGPAAGAAPAGADVEQQRRIDELIALEARHAVLSVEVKLLVKEKNTLRAQIAAHHNSTQSCLVQLPAEVRQLLLCMLGVQALGRLATTCKDWQHNGTDLVVWRVNASTAGPTCLCKLFVHLNIVRENVELATICCQRLMELAGSDHTRPALVATLVSTGSAKGVVGAMQAHVGVAAVQELVCAAVVNLLTLHRDWYSARAEGMAALLAAGAAELLVGAMRAHVGVARLQGKGCEALGTLALDDKNKAAVLAAGAAGAIVGAMRAHVGVKEVKMWSLTAAVHLWFDEEGKTALRRAGLERTCRDASRNHPEYMKFWAALQRHDL